MSFPCQRQKRGHKASQGCAYPESVAVLRIGQVALSQVPCPGPVASSSIQEEDRENTGAFLSASGDRVHLLKSSTSGQSYRPHGFSPCLVPNKGQSGNWRQKGLRQASLPFSLQKADLSSMAPGHSLVDSAVSLSLLLHSHAQNAPLPAVPVIGSH